MIKVICTENHTHFDALYFECLDHAEYRNPATGNNDVCVATSALCSMLVRYVTAERLPVKCCEDGHVQIEIVCPGFRCAEVFRAAMMQFEALAEEFPEHIKIY
jgi:uncharacterized protein YsxB (DUF464 family)